MKTLTKLTLATLFAVSVAAPASANTLTESLSEVVSNQLTDISQSIKLQAKQQLENTISELFFNLGSEQAEQAVQNTTAPAISAATVTDDASQLQQ